jgi:hypothetical protein
MNNTEQIEADLFRLIKDKTRVNVVLPLHGTICLTFEGVLVLERESTEFPHSIFHLADSPDPDSKGYVGFRAHDVYRIAENQPSLEGIYNVVLIRLRAKHELQDHSYETVNSPDE